MQEKQKSPRNKTIDFTLEDGAKYLNRCMQFHKNDSCKNAFALSKIIDKTICADTFEVMPMLPHSFVDLAIIDPPYNLRKNYGGNIFSSQSSDEYIKYTENWLSLLLPLLKSHASFYICCDWKTSILIADVLAKFQTSKKLIIQNRITWEREKGRGAKANWKNSMEDIWFCTTSSNYTFNIDKVKIRKKVIAPYRTDGIPKDWQETENGKIRLTHPSNFWDDISVPYWSMPENTAHPTQKPEKLLAKLILASSNTNDTVFDPFLGSGSTSVTAKKLSRHWCGIEQNPQYCAWAEKRLETAENNNSIQGYENGFFLERNFKLKQ